MFPTLLKYLESIKGGMRNLALDIANQKIEEKVEEEEPQPVDGLEEVVFFFYQNLCLFYFIHRVKSLK